MVIFSLPPCIHTHIYIHSPHTYIYIHEHTYIYIYTHSSWKYLKVIFFLSPSTYVNVQTRSHTPTFVQTNTHTPTYIHFCICRLQQTPESIYARTYVCICTHTQHTHTHLPSCSKCLNVFTHVCIYMYTHTHTQTTAQRQQMPTCNYTRIYLMVISSLPPHAHVYCSGWFSCKSVATESGRERHSNRMALCCTVHLTLPLSVAVD